MILEGVRACACDCCNEYRSQMDTKDDKGAMHRAQPGRRVARGGRNELGPLHWLVISLNIVQKTYAHLASDERRFLFSRSAGAAKRRNRAATFSILHRQKVPRGCPGSH